MRSLEKMREDLLGMSLLLRKFGKPDWASALAELGDRLREDPGGVSRRYVNMYGGAGSLSDIVLYNGNRPAIKENEALNTFRRSAFFEASEIITNL